MSTDGTDDPEDEISQIAAYGTEYERLRLTGGWLTGVSLPRKVQLHGLLLVCLASIYPIALTLPPAAHALFQTSRPALGSPIILVIGAFGAVLQVFGGLVTLAIARRLLASGPESVDARRFVAAESLASGLGFGTGGFAIGLTVGFFLAHLAGRDATRLLRQVASNARGPYAPSGIGLSVRTLALIALVSGVCLLLASRTVVELADS